MRLILFVLCVILSFTVQADDGCSVSASSLNFGVYNPESASPDDSSANIVLTCDEIERVKVALNQGQSHSYSPRTMVGPHQNQLNYNIYYRSFRRVWGNGASGTRKVSTKVRRKGKTLTMLGRIPVGQNDLSAGQYHDAITVEVDY